MEEMEKCIICMQKNIEKDGHLISPQSYDSWQSLLEAAKIRKHDPIINAARQLGDSEVPKIFYHRKCRSIFTMKRDLISLTKRKLDKDLNDEASCSSKRPCRRASASRVYDPVCIFCDKQKYLKGSKSREKLTQAVQLRADQTLRECAIRKGDEKIIAVASRDVVAAEAHYHHSCYKNYTRVRTNEQKHDCEERDGNDDMYKMIEREAFANLFEFIRSDVIPNKKIIPVTSLTAKLESFILSDGIELVRSSTRKHIRRRLESELMDSVHIFPDDKGRLLLVPDSVTLCLTTCLEQNPQVPSPVGRGWKMDKQGSNELLVVDWMDGQPAPQAILDLLACNCARKCELPKCECMANGLKCTEMCRLADCDNQASQAEDESTGELDEDDDLEDNDY